MHVPYVWYVYTPMYTLYIGPCMEGEHYGGAPMSTITITQVEVYSPTTSLHNLEHLMGEFYIAHGYYREDHVSLHKELLAQQ